MKTIRGLILITIIALLGSLVVVEKFTDQTTNNILNGLRFIEKSLAFLPNVFGTKSTLTEKNFTGFMQHANIAQMNLNNVGDLIKFYPSEGTSKPTKFSNAIQMIGDDLVKIAKFCAEMSKNKEISPYDQGKMASYSKLYLEQAQLARDIKIMMESRAGTSVSGSMGQTFSFSTGPYFCKGSSDGNNFTCKTDPLTIV